MPEMHAAVKQHLVPETYITWQYRLTTSEAGATQHCDVESGAVDSANDPGDRVVAIVTLPSRARGRGHGTPEFYYKSAKYSASEV
jgi:hypothetical protein